jgi:hypothetical protein
MMKKSWRRTEHLPISDKIIITIFTPAFYWPKGLKFQLGTVLKQLLKENKSQYIEEAI